MRSNSFRTSILLTAILAFVLCIQQSYALTEDDFDFTDAVMNPPSEDHGTTDESDQLSILEGELAGFTVTLDPGHGSEVNNGLTEIHGVTERHINWVLTNEIADILRSYGCNVILTKSGEDQIITNMERAEIANSSDSAAFVRLHCDSGPPEAHGTTFYYPDRQGEWYGHTGPPLELIPMCEQLATVLHQVVTSKLDGLFYDRGVQTDNETYIGNQQGGALRGSILSQVPVCLVEVCFLSNADDVAIITNDEKRSEIANALAEGIRQYLDQLPTESD